MTKVVVAMSMSLDGIAGPASADAEGMAVFTAILGGSSRCAAGVSSRAWKAEGLGGPRGCGRELRAVRPAGCRPDHVRLRLSELGGEPTVPRARVRGVLTIRGQERIEKRRTSHTSWTGGVAAAVEQAVRCRGRHRDVLLARAGRHRRARGAGRRVVDEVGAAHGAEADRQGVRPSTRRG